MLVIEDELRMCEVAKEVLEAHGLTVLTAMDGQEGVALFRDHAQDGRTTLDLVTFRHDGSRHHQ